MRALRRVLGATTLALALLAGPVQAAPTPIALSARAGHGAVTLSWRAPAGLIGYVVSDSTDGVHFSEVRATTTTSTDVTGLVNGRRYYFSVIGMERGAANTLAGELTSDVVEATPTGPPGAPTVLAVYASNHRVTVSVRPPANDGGSPVRVLVVLGPATRGCRRGLPASAAGVPGVAPAVSCVVGGLRDGRRYRFRAVALSAAGRSAFSAWSASVVPGPVPAAPGSVVAVPGDQSVTTYWSPAFGGGVAVNGYVVSVSPGGETCATHGATPATSCTVSGLQNGLSYVASVVATSATGTSAPTTAPSPATPTPAVFSAPVGPFAPGSSALPAPVSTQVAQLVSFVETSQSTSIVVTGYANDVASANALAVAMRRARAVVSALQSALPASSSVTFVTRASARTTTTADGSSVVVSVS